MENEQKLQKAGYKSTQTRASQPQASRHTAAVRHIPVYCGMGMAVNIPSAEKKERKYCMVITPNVKLFDCSTRSIRL